MIGPSIITKAKAQEQGLTGSFLRTVANSLERIARSSGDFTIEYVYNRHGDTRKSGLSGLQNFDAQTNRRHAYELRRLAKELS